MVAQVVQAAVDHALHAPAGDSLQRVDAVQRQAIGLGGAGHGLGHRVIGACRQARGQQPGARLVAAQAVEVGLRRAAFGEGAGLVQGQPLQLAAQFEEHPALDQDADARRRRQAADDGHRGGDHQRAGAGDHQQHQGAVHPVEPGAAEGQRRDERGGDGDEDHHRRVDARELIDEALRRRPRALGFLYGVDDPRQGAVVGAAAHRILQRALAVDAAGEQGFTGLLFHRQALAGDGRLVDAGAALDHLAVEGDAFSGAHAHALAHGHRLGRHVLPLPVAQHRGLFRGQLQQAADSAARTFQGARLDQLGDGEQHRDHGRFRPLADEHGAGHGDAHQRVDVQVAVLQGDPALAVGRQAGAEDGRHGQGCHQPLRAEGEPFADFRGQRQHPGQGQRPPGLVPGRGAGERLAVFHGLGLHAQGGDQLLQRLQAVEAVLHLEQALHQVEFQLLHRRQLAQGVAQQALLGGAVHGLDAQAAPAQLTSGGGCGGELRRFGVARALVVVVMPMLVFMAMHGGGGVVVAAGPASRLAAVGVGHQVVSHLTVCLRLHTL